MSRRCVEVEPGVAYETCDPEPSDPKTKEALADMARAAVRHIREQQRPCWEYHQEDWDLYPSLAQAMQRVANLGEDGWELVTIVGAPMAAVENGSATVRDVAIFKRGRI
jgi:hypothetical protein